MLKDKGVYVLHAYMYESIPKLPLPVGCLRVLVQEKTLKYLNPGSVTRLLEKLNTSPYQYDYVQL